MVGTDEKREARLRAKLLAPTADELAPPYVDPRIAALVALGVVDFAKSPEGRGRFAELEALDGYDPAIIADLHQLAEALLRVVEAFRVVPRDPKPVRISSTLDAECRARRATLVTVLSKQAARAPMISAALRRVDLAYGAMDLACDLRALAALIDRHEPDVALAANTRVLARKLEDALTSYDTPELREARRALHRVWWVFEATYRQLADIGRELFSDDPEALFPTLDAIAGNERTARSRSSPNVPAAMLVERSLPPSIRIPPSRVPISVARAAIDTSPVVAEVILAANSESNLWLGFSQDIAEGGVFLATYTSHPLGAPMHLEVQLPGSERTLRVSGVVQWLRPLGAGDEIPPGIGVRLTQLGVETARALQTFAAYRTPIFYDE